MKSAVRSFLFVLIALFAAQAWAAKPVVGTYSANGQDGKLAFALALSGEPFSGNPTTKLVFTEKDASADKQPDFHAAFGDFGNALVITLMKDSDGYSVIGAEFGHTALKHMGASATGVLDVKDVKAANGRLSGKLVSGADADIFGEPIKVDLAFDVKLP
ncbi:MAG: hypothetical protein KF811_06915 [Dokdonella sp.]|nr:hypothetical protein [Dokdonella sp.]